MKRVTELKFCYIVIGAKFFQIITAPILRYSKANRINVTSMW